MIDQSHNPAAERTPRPFLVTFLVAGVLAVGGGVGMALNQTQSIHATVRAAGLEREADASESAPGAAQEVAAVGETAVATLPSGAADLRVANVSVPENPFLPSAAPVAPKPAAGPQAAKPGASAQIKSPQQGPAVKRPAAAPAAPAAAAPTPEELQLSGIVHGDPPLVVLKYGGQSLFLKAGDQVADTWRLAEIKERSAIFQLGERRIEVQIQGGSAQ